MEDKEFLKRCKTAIKFYLENNQNPFNRVEINTEDIFIVWFSNILQNNKALLSTNGYGSDNYFEVTYNGDKDEFYIDVYKRWQSFNILGNTNGSQG